MKGGKAIMLGLFAVAAAIFFHALSTRYQLSTAGDTGVAFRIDGLTGQVCALRSGDSKFGSCTWPGK